jgi:hypothetical protein
LLRPNIRVVLSRDAQLKSDSRLLVSAASQAQKAADFIQGKTGHQTAKAQAV